MQYTQAQNSTARITVPSQELRMRFHSFSGPGVENTMQRLVRLLDDGNNPNGCSFNFYYYHLLMQVRLYYPNVEKKIAAIFEQNFQLWKSAIEKAKESGEIRQDVDVDEAASMFWQIFFGTSFEKSFFQGLDTKKLARSLHFLYSLLKA